MTGMLAYRLKGMLRQVLPASVIRKLVGTSKEVRRFWALARRVSDLERKILTRTYPGLAKAAPNMLLKNMEMQVYSQNGEDGLTLYYLSQIPTKGRFVEVGVEDGLECNTGILSLHFGWRGLLVEGDTAMAERARGYYAARTEERVQVVSSFARPDNINALLAQAGYAKDLDLLSIDVDGFDYWLWESVKEVSPSLVIMEYNWRFGEERSCTVPYEADFNRFKKRVTGDYFGASLTALYRLGRHKGYDLIGCDSTGCNAYFMRSDLRAATSLAELTPKEAYQPRARPGKQRDAQEFLKMMKGLPLVDIPETFET
jgi:hypothetical protein